MSQLSTYHLDRDRDKTREELLAELNTLRTEVTNHRLVTEIAQRIQTSLNLQDILQTTVKEVRQLLQTDRVIIFQFDPTWNGTVVVESVGEAYSAILATQIYDPCFSETYVEPFKQGLVTAKSDIYTAGIDECHLNLLATYQVRANLVVPILQHQTLWGLLIAHHCAAPRHWQASEISLLQQLATHLGIAIQQSTLFEQVQVELLERQRTEVALRKLTTELEQRVAERTAELTAQEKLLSTFFDAAALAGIGLGIHDRQTRIVRLNQMLADINGIPLADHLGKTIDEVLPKPLATAIQAQFDQVIASGQPIINLEMRGETTSRPGVLRDWLINFFPTFDPNGSVNGLGTVVIEVTERKQAEEIVRRNEERLQLALEGAGDGLWDWDLTTGELYFSPRWLEMLGYSQDELPRHINTWEQLIHPDDRPWVAEQLDAHLHNNSVPYSFNYRLLCKSGAWLWVATYGKVVARDAAGNPLRMVGLHKDVSEQQAALQQQQQAEEALRQSEAQFRSLSESSPIGIFRTDVQGQCIYSNPSCQKIWGLSLTEALGQGWMRHIHPDDRAHMTACWSETMSTQKGFSIEVRYRQTNGTIRFCRIHTAPILTETGNIIGYVGTMEDITESRAIAQMKNEFISIVSHELRTPLTSLRGSLGLIAGGIYDNKPEKRKRMLQVAAQSADRLVRLVSDILDLERLESGKVAFVMQSCDVPNLMLQSIEAMRTEAEQNQITLASTPLDAQVWAASDAIIQTLTNLLSNAIKFSEPGAIVELKAEIQASETRPPSLTESPDLAEPSTSSFVLFSVQDQGRGIPADKLETIFGQFQQVDASDSRQKGGTGLGLSICRRIVQQHGGKIWAESYLGKGSTFYFTLPMPTAEQIAKQILDQREMNNENT